MKTLLLFAILIAATSTFSVALSAPRMKYVHVEGIASGRTGGDVIQELTSAFVDPLQAPGMDVLKNFSMVVDGAKSHFVFNLIIDPQDIDSIAKTNQYIALLEAAGIFGVPVRFRGVRELVTDAELQIGYYDALVNDAFVVTHSATRQDTFANLREWNDFSNEYGRALLSTTHTDFQTYIGKFLAGLPNEADALLHLSQNNMMAIFPNTVIMLDDGTSAGRTWDEAPFIPFRFIRSCFSPQFENGNCLN